MRRSFTLCSVGAHTIVITAALYAQILGDGSLPTPRRPLTFDGVPFVPIVVQMPQQRVTPARASDATAMNAAPIAPPDGVSKETGNEDRSAPLPSGPIPGIETGPPAPIEIVGSGVPVPPPPPQPATPVRVGSGIRTPVKVVDVSPVYPAIARSAHVQGVVILEALLDAQGRVESTRVLRSVPLL